MTTWANLRTEIQALTDDGSVESAGTLYSSLLTWANRIIVEISEELNINALLTSSTATFTTSNWIWSLPTDFQKYSRRYTLLRTDNSTKQVFSFYNDGIIGLEELNALDSIHTTTTSNAYPDKVALEGGNIHVYPLFAGDLVLENYYRIPTDMAADSDSPDLPETSITADLIVAGVCGKYIFPRLNEKELAKDYYDDSTYPGQGQFFQLLRRYDKYLGDSVTPRSNLAVDY